MYNIWKVSIDVGIIAEAEASWNKFSGNEVTKVFLEKKILLQAFTFVIISNTIKESSIKCYNRLFEMIVTKQQMCSKEDYNTESKAFHPSA